MNPVFEMPMAVRNAAVAEAIKTLKVLKIDMKADERTLFELVQNPVYWKEPTIPAIVSTEQEARRLQDAISYFAGGAERKTISAYNNTMYLVTSKGYYEYIGA